MTTEIYNYFPRVYKFRGNLQYDKTFLAHADLGKYKENGFTVLLQHLLVVNIMFVLQ